MIPIYFPFTFTTRHLMAAVQPFFSRLAVYLPSARMIPPTMRRWKEEGRLDLRFPYQNAEDRLAALLRDYHNWAALHHDKHGRGLSHLRTRKGAIPFFEETSASQILADLKGIAAPADSEIESRVFSARVFLSIAQEMDAQAEELEADLQRAEERERRLFQELKGETAETGEAHFHRVAAGRPAEFMFAERLAAWSALVQSEFEPVEADAAGVFVTAGRHALDHLQEAEPAMVELLSLAGAATAAEGDSGGAAGRPLLLKHLLELTFSDRPVEAADGVVWPECGETGDAAGRTGLKIYLIPGRSPAAVFRGLMRRPSGLEAGASPGGKIKNTVIAWVGS